MKICKVDKEYVMLYRRLASGRLVASQKPTLGIVTHDRDSDSQKSGDRGDTDADADAQNVGTDCLTQTVPTKSQTRKQKITAGATDSTKEIEVGKSNFSNVTYGLTQGLQNASFLRSVSIDKAGNPFMARVKGSKSYNTQIFSKRLAVLNDWKAENRILWFITAELEESYKSLPLKEQYTEIDRARTEIVKRLSSNYAAKTMVTIESTVDGHPHIHALIALPKNVDTQESVIKTAVEHVSSILIGAISVVTDDRAFYYVNKSLKVGFEELAKKVKDNKQLSDDEIKVANAWYYTTLYNVRQYTGATKKRVGVPQSEITEEPEEKESRLSSEVIRANYIIQNALRTGVCTEETDRAFVVWVRYAYPEGITQLAFVNPKDKESLSYIFENDDSELLSVVWDIRKKWQINDLDKTKIESVTRSWLGLNSQMASNHPFF